MEAFKRVYTGINKIFGQYKMSLLSLLGLSAVGLITTELFNNFYKNMLPKHDSLLQKYGKGSWAIVTNATKKTGKAFCKELAKKGFNLVLISTDKHLLRKLNDDLKKLYPNISIKKQVMDETRSQEACVEKIYDLVKDLDVSILVNDIGVSRAVVNPDLDMSLEDSQMFSIVSAFPVLLTKKLIPKFSCRKSRSAIIMVCPEDRPYNLPILNDFDSTKTYLDLYTRSLAYEFSNKIDFVSVRASPITSQIFFKTPTMRDTLTTQGCVKYAFNKLASEKPIEGVWKNQLWSNYVTHSIIFKVLCLRGVIRQQLSQDKNNCKSSDLCSKGNESKNKNKENLSPKSNSSSCAPDQTGDNK